MLQLSNFSINKTVIAPPNVITGEAGNLYDIAIKSRRIYVQNEVFTDFYPNHYNFKIFPAGLSSFSMPLRILSAGQRSVKISYVKAPTLETVGRYVTLKINGVTYGKSTVTPKIAQPHSSFFDLHFIPSIDMLDKTIMVTLVSSVVLSSRVVMELS